MTAALEEDTTNYTKTVEIQQKGADWVSTIEWPEDLTGADADVTVGGKATITYTPTTDGTKGTVAVTYSGS